MWAIAGGLAPLTPVGWLAGALWIVPPIGLVCAAGLVLFTWRIRRAASPRTGRLWSAAVWSVVVGPVVLPALVLVMGAPGSALPTGGLLVVQGVLTLLILVLLSAMTAVASFMVGRRFWGSDPR